METQGIVIFSTLQQLSQFWYSEETAEMLAKEVMEHVGENGRYFCRFLYGSQICVKTLSNWKEKYNWKIFHNFFRIACLSCPTLYHKLRDIKPDGVKLHILEYDSRFEKFGEDFVFYDYNKPLEIHESMKNYYDIVVADPPFLSEECLTKTAITVKFMTKDKILLCTGKFTPLDFTVVPYPIYGILFKL